MRREMLIECGLPNQATRQRRRDRQGPHLRYGLGATQQYDGRVAETSEMIFTDFDGRKKEKVRLRTRIDCCRDSTLNHSRPRLGQHGIDKLSTLATEALSTPFQFTIAASDETQKVRPPMTTFCSPSNSHAMVHCHVEIKAENELLHFADP